MPSAKRDARTALVNRGTQLWSGEAHRAHGPRRSAIDLGNGMATGRYHKGLDQYPHEEAFRVLYLGLAREVCMGETMRHINPADHDSVLRQ